MIKVNNVLNNQAIKNIRKRNIKKDSTILSPFEKDCKDLFQKFEKTDDIIKNQHDFGYFIRHHNNDEVNEFELKTIKKYVREYLSKTNNCANKKNYHFANMIYSTLLKVITPEHILTKQITPTSYRSLIDDSIKMYYEHVLKEGIDYRHILGRLQSLRKMSASLNKKYPMLPKYFAPVNWTSAEQLDYIGILENINKHFTASIDNFALRSAYMMEEKNKFFTKELIAANYEKGIIKALGLLYSEAKKLLAEPRKNCDAIKNRIELAEYYIDKVPINDKHGAVIFSFLNNMKDIEKQLYKSME